MLPSSYLSARPSINYLRRANLNNTTASQLHLNGSSALGTVSAYQLRCSEASCTHTVHRPMRSWTLRLSRGGCVITCRGARSVKDSLASFVPRSVRWLCASCSCGWRRRSSSTCSALTSEGRSGMAVGLERIMLCFVSSPLSVRVVARRRVQVVMRKVERPGYQNKPRPGRWSVLYSEEDRNGA